MEILNALKQAVKTCAEVVKWAAGIQGATRDALVSDLQAICANCDAAYDAVLARLLPVKNSFLDPAALATELRAFAADAKTRASFKPDHLCGQVDGLLVKLSSHLDPLKYSIDCRRIDDLRRYLRQFGNFDDAIFQSYDQFMTELDRVATQIQDSSSDNKERSQYAQRVIESFENDLRTTQHAVREAKALTLSQI